MTSIHKERHEAIMARSSRFPGLIIFDDTSAGSVRQKVSLDSRTSNVKFPMVVALQNTAIAHSIQIDKVVSVARKIFAHRFGHFVASMSSIAPSRLQNQRQMLLLVRKFDENKNDPVASLVRRVNAALDRFKPTWLSNCHGCADEEELGGVFLCQMILLSQPLKTLSWLRD
ncbi:hypothetical protein BU26DRAFT_561038 [Trematosphaeria pertusa]|uniref:Uncharacterized protein n=1 Tax=Trematosphaeria pertusa TaxID=390896 RepID=A0A6A6IX29_9PLEO|nr:uncharacterized protein BU26DRAFT_561038 [Trematosphaeria pertusa]KAF2253763.1 hypothetical protein BU26DRAFT_561038 [Trematosphaeria pertusa]